MSDYQGCWERAGGDASGGGVRSAEFGEYSVDPIELSRRGRNTPYSTIAKYPIINKSANFQTSKLGNLQYLSISTVNYEHRQRAQIILHQNTFS